MADLPLSPATRLVAGGRPAHQPGASLNAPVELTSTYVAGAPVNYARVDNPTWRAFEDVLGELEGGSALAYASGMAAISAALSLAPVGAVVVAPHHAYNGTGALLAELAEQGVVQVRRVDIADTDEVLAALDGAALLWTESPTNPMLEIADLPTLFAAARERGVVSVCDNTFSTPLLQRPLELGADVVVHSVTKFLSGHSDVLLGAAVTADEGLRERLHTHRTLRGAIPGTGAIVAIEPVGGRAAAERVEQAVRVWTPATSLGGVESLLERRRRHPAEPPTVPEQLVRLSVGVEDVEDLWRDLDRALSD